MTQFFADLLEQVPDAKPGALAASLADSTEGEPVAECIEREPLRTQPMRPMATVWFRQMKQRKQKGLSA